MFYCLKKIYVMFLKKVMFSKMKLCFLKIYVFFCIFLKSYFFFGNKSCVSKMLFVFVKIMFLLDFCMELFLFQLASGFDVESNGAEIADAGLDE